MDLWLPPRYPENYIPSKNCGFIGVLSVSTCSQGIRGSRPILPHGSVTANSVLILDQFELQQDGALEGGKIVVRYHGQDGASVGGPMDAESFHIVDLVAQVGKRQNRSIDERAGPDIGQCDPAQPHRNAGQPV